MATAPKEGEEPETLNFKEANDSNNQSSRGCITCPFYNELSHVMGDKPSCKPLELLDSYGAGEEEPETLKSSADSVMRLMSFLFLFCTCGSVQNWKQFTLESDIGHILKGNVNSQTKNRICANNLNWALRLGVWTWLKTLSRPQHLLQYYTKYLKDLCWQNAEMAAKSDCGFRCICICMLVIC